MTKLKLSFFGVLICLVGRLTVQAQQLVAPQPQPGRINGTVTDVGGAVVPGASAAFRRTHAAGYSLGRGERRCILSI